VPALVPVPNVIGEMLYLPAWHPRVILDRHNDELVKRRQYKGVRAHNGLSDLQRWDFPVHEDETHDEDIRRIIRAIPTHRAAASYFIYNSALATTAAPVKQPTGTSIRTMLQLRVALSVNARLVAWGCSFDGSAAATPGQVELFENTAAATMSTAYAAADIQPYTPVTGLANTAGATGVPFNLSTATSGFATAAVTEGTVSGYRGADLAMLPPTAPYVYQWPLGREFELTPQNYLRCRMTFATTVNTYIWLLIEV
jgi:hypothetical protein